MANEIFQQNEFRLLRLPEVLLLTGIARSTIYQWIGEGRFPPPIKIGGGRCSGWRFKEIASWVESCGCQ